MSGGEAGVFPRGAAKHWLAPGENGVLELSLTWGVGWDCFRVLAASGIQEGSQKMLSHLGVGGWGGREALIRELGLSETTASLGTGTSPGFCPLHSSFWGLDSGEGLERAGAFLIPSAWRRLPSVLMGSFV